MQQHSTNHSTGERMNTLCIFYPSGLLVKKAVGNKEGTGITSGTGIFVNRG